MVKKQSKNEIYRIERFSMERRARLPYEIAAYAEAIQGLPQNHSEVFFKRGWLLPYLFTYDDLLWGRWSYWLDILQKGIIEGSGPIPRIEWESPAESTKKMFARCMNHHESTIDSFASWLL
ncbi:hypothetical protein [Paenibacillus thiaminolyticus]|uniref:hypothetical protein n=1 Tax=Paenibacillus thiaminolyticus TaxID=49283 RepID=UPI002543EB41|nr:hypothetical protein [Paenibacillus thiaminolyticus]WII35290.1 hypothetical protein O0V01_16435 [Paenibacillus thiaminolyticus]